jgi:shikimate 5-dehydrogenase
VGGRRWLLWQAVAGYALFTGEEPDAEKMSAVL